MIVRHVWAIFNLTPSVRRATEAILSIVYRPKVRVISVFLGPLQYHVLQIAFFLLRIHRDKARIAFGKESVFPFVFPCFVPLISRRDETCKTFYHAILAHSFGEYLSRLETTNFERLMVALFELMEFFHTYIISRDAYLIYVEKVSNRIEVCRIIAYPF